MSSEDDEVTVIKADGYVSGAQTPLGQKGKGKIAIDMDDVLCQTNATIVGMHNEVFKLDPPLTLAGFKHYLYWQNYGWGDPKKTIEMVRRRVPAACATSVEVERIAAHVQTELYAKGLYMRSPPVPGAKEALLKLKERGYTLILVTARSERQREGTEEWLTTYMPDSAFQHLDPTKEEREGHASKKSILYHQKRTKAEIIHATGSLLLIDDSAENALDASKAETHCPVLLFGNYPWNAVVLDPAQKDKLDDMTYVDLKEQGLLDVAEQRREQRIKEAWLPDHVERVKDWDAVVAWLDDWESNGRRDLRTNDSS